MSSIGSLLPDYPTYDQNTGLDVLQSFNAKIGTTSSGSITSSPAQVKRLVDSQAIPGHSYDQLNAIENKFLENAASYVDSTKELVVINDLVNVNRYMNNSMQSEVKRTQNLRDQTFNNVYRTKQSYLMKWYDIEYNSFVTHIIQFTLFIFILCGSLYATTLDPRFLFNKVIVFWIIGIAVLIYLLMILLLFKSVTQRRRDDFNKFYFGSMS